ncbi:MAG: hypothetical protein ACR2FP_00655 [Nocardioidaceae bacterium]
MSGRRRLPRSKRIVVAVGLIAATGVIVVVLVLTDVAVGVAAVGAVVAGGVSLRLIYTEVTHARRLAARERAEQSREFGAALTKVYREHRAFSEVMSSRLAQHNRTVQHRDATITRLRGTLRLAERQLGELDECAQRESGRAQEAEERLSALLDEVLTQPPLRAVQRAVEDDASGLPTVVDLVAWEERVTQAVEASQQDSTDSRLQA